MAKVTQEEVLGHIQHLRVGSHTCGPCMVCERAKARIHMYIEQHSDEPTPDVAKALEAFERILLRRCTIGILGGIDLTNDRDDIRLIENALKCRSSLPEATGDTKAALDELDMLCRCCTANTPTVSGARDIITTALRAGDDALKGLEKLSADLQHQYQNVRDLQNQLADANAEIEKLRATQPVDDDVAWLREKLVKMRDRHLYVLYVVDADRLERIAKRLEEAHDGD